jgi:hypothetical protein
MSKISPERFRTFIAGGLALAFFKMFAEGICEVVASAIAGTFLWRVLVGTVVVGTLGFILAIAFLVGKRWAYSLVRIFLVLFVAGDCISFVMPLLHMQTGLHTEAWENAADLIVDATFLVLVLWCKPPKHETPNTALEPTPTAP